MADSLRTVIGTTLVIGGVLTGVLILRDTRFAPDWLRAPEPAPSSSTNPGLVAPVLPPPPQTPQAAVAEVPPPPTTEVSPSGAASVASATPEPSASAPEPVASASAGKARKGAPGAGQPAEPEVVELPADYRYAPPGAGNLTFPVSPPTASTAAPP